MLEQDGDRNERLRSSREADDEQPANDKGHGEQREEGGAHGWGFHGLMTGRRR